MDRNPAAAQSGTTRIAWAAAAEHGAVGAGADTPQPEEFVVAASGDDALPMRRWIALQAPGLVPAAGHRRVERTVLFQLAGGSIRMLRMDASRAWDGDARRMLAEVLSGEPHCHELSRQARMRLERCIGCRVRFVAPSFDPHDPAAWPLVELATQHVIGSAFGGSRHLARRSGQADRLIRQLAGAIRRSLDRHLAVFRASLDPALLAVSMRDGRFDAAQWNFVAGADGTRYRNRLQFLTCNPHFADLATGALRCPDVGDALRAVIDDARPLVDFLAKRFHVGSATIRHLARQPPHPRAGFWRRRLQWALRLTDSLPAARRPATEADWAAYGILTHVATGLFGDPLLNRQAFDWVRARNAAEIRELCELSGDRDVLARTLATISDYRTALANVITHLALPRDPKRREASLRRAALELLDARHVSMRFARLRGLAEDWRRADARPEPESVEDQAGRLAIQRQSYLPLLPEPMVVNGWRITPVVSRRALLHAAHQMHNCLAGYHSICEGGTHLLCTVGHAGEAGIRTVAEFSLWIDGNGNVRPVVQQHLGPWNALPPPACVEAIEVLLSTAMQPALQRHLRLLRPRLVRPGGFRASRAIETMRAVHSESGIDRLVAEALQVLGVRDQGRGR